MKIIIKSGLIIIGIFAFACQEFLDEEIVSDVSYSHYKTSEGIESGVGAAYDALRNHFENDINAALQTLGTDTYWDGRGAPSKTQLNYEASLNSAFAPLYNGHWAVYYRAINTANTVLDAIKKISDEEMSANLKAVRTGELRFLRAFYYFNLVQTYGKIPLVTVPELGVKTDFERAPIEQVYKLIISDLRFAVDNLPPTQNDYGRATKGAAQHALSLVYLTRGSAVTDQRGQQPTDMDSAAYFADEVIFSDAYQLVPDFKDLWDVSNQMNSEVIFAAQFSRNQLYNNNTGNRIHLYFGMVYDLKPGMTRTLEYGRPFPRMNPTPFTILELFDRKNDSRFYKTFRTIWYSNNPKNIPKWEAKGGFVPPAELSGKPKFSVGDTAIWVTAEVYPEDTNFDSLYASRPYYYMPMNRQDHLIDYFALSKHLDPTRLGFNDEIGFRDGILYRLGETYLIAAEAYGRKGDLPTAVKRLNVLRKRAAYKEGELKPGEYWKVEGGTYADRFKSTEAEVLLTVEDLTAGQSFVDFMLDERAREMNGELRRWWDLVRTEKLVERVVKHNSHAAGNVREYHRYRPIPQNHIDRLDPKRPLEEMQNEGYY